MNNKIKFFLNDENCFQKRQIKLINPKGINNPYDFKTPSPITSKQLELIGNLGMDIILKHNKDNKKIHLIGIASRGLHMATAISLALEKESISNNLSIAKLDTNEDVCMKCSKQSFNVLIDNSIKTGNTLKKTIKQLTSKQIKIDIIIHLYDFNVFHTNQKLSEELNIKIESIFTIKHVINYFRQYDKLFYAKLFKFYNKYCKNIHNKT